MKSFRSSLFQKAGEVSGRSPESPAAACEIPALLLRRRLLRNPRRGFGKNKTQRIVIYYRFVGYLDLPDTIPQDNYREDTRQGVAIEYVTDKPQPDAADAAS